MKVLAIATDNDRPEAEMLCALNERGIEVSIVIKSDSKFIPLYEKNGLRVIPLVFNSRLDFKAIRQLRELFEKERFDICHTFSKIALSNAIVASRGIEIKHIAYRGIVGNLSRLDPFSQLSFLHPRIDRLVCVCKAIEIYLRKFPFLNNKVQTIYKGHKPEWYQAHSRAIMQKFGIPENARVACCVANLRPRKGIEVLLEAARMIPREEEIHFLLIGHGMESLELPDRVHACGFRSDAPQLVGACDLVVMPSLRREGLPKAVLEGMAQGVPAVVSDVGGLSEIVEDGESGRIVEPGEAGELSLAIQDVLSERASWTVYSSNAKRRVLEQFNFDATVESYFDLYSELAGFQGNLAANQ